METDKQAGANQTNPVPETAGTKAKTPISRGHRAVFWLLSSLLLFFLLEGTLRLAIWAYQKWAPITAANAYHPPDDNHSGSEKPSGGGGGEEGRPIYQKNYSGPQVHFRGPVPQGPKTPGKIRILCLGDSCTYGYPNPDNYPRRMEEELQRRGLDVQVLNAGWNGAKLSDLIKYAPWFLKFQPDLVTVYIGWNSLPSRPQPGFGDRQFKTFYLLRWFSYALPNLWGRPNYYREIKGYRYHSPLEPQLRQLLGMIRESGARPVLLTLTGMFCLQEPEQAGKLLPYCRDFRGNAFILAASARDYNRMLREIARKERVTLIDVEPWGKKAFEPRQQYFLDAVHFRQDGYALLGNYLGEKLSPLLKNPEKQRNRPQAVSPRRLPW